MQHSLSENLYFTGIVNSYMKFLSAIVPYPFPLHHPETPVGGRQMRMGGRISPWPAKNPCAVGGGHPPILTTVVAPSLRTCPGKNFLDPTDFLEDG